MRDENCIFCKIANGEIPSRTLYEDDRFRVILDLGPATKGHALILPKNHYADLFALPEDEAAEAAKLAKKMGAKLVEKLHADGLNVVQNNGETAGQTVKHFHIHLIPRYENDGQHILWNPGKMSDEELDSVAETVDPSLSNQPWCRASGLRFAGKFLRAFPTRMPHRTRYGGRHGERNSGH